MGFYRIMWVYRGVWSLGPGGLVLQGPQDYPGHS